MKIDNLKGPSGADQYQNLLYYASGGMGIIYSAKDSVTNEDVAIKAIRIDDHDYKTILENEFKIATALSHENILRTEYYNEFDNSSGYYFYCVSEFCSAGNLRKRILNESQFIPLSECLSYFYDLLRGLQEAHKVIVYRDLKPENILIGNNGNLKICDFGIAKYVNELTRTRTFKGSGTYPYMAPECWVGDDNTIQMDIYYLFTWNNIF